MVAVDGPICQSCRCQTVPRLVATHPEANDCELLMGTSRCPSTGLHRLALIEAGTVWRKKITLLSDLRVLFHIANDGLPAVVYMDVIDAGKLLPPELSPPPFNDFRRD